MVKKKKSANLGGVRPGAGRKSTGVITRSITIFKQDFKDIEKYNPFASRSAFFQAAAQKYLAQLKKGQQELALPG